MPTDDERFNFYLNETKVKVQQINTKTHKIHTDEKNNDNIQQKYVFVKRTMLRRLFAHCKLSSREMKKKRTNKKLLTQKNFHGIKV